jgi:hypothetical protein
VTRSRSPFFPRAAAARWYRRCEGADDAAKEDEPMTRRGSMGKILFMKRETFRVFETSSGRFS